MFASTHYLQVFLRKGVSQKFDSEFHLSEAILHFIIEIVTHGSYDVLS